MLQGKYEHACSNVIIMGATEEHNLTEVFLCITILKLFLNGTILVADIIKPVAVSSLLLKKKLYGFMHTDCRSLNAGTWNEAEPMPWVDNILDRV